MSVHTSLRPKGLIISKQTRGQKQSAERKRRCQKERRAFWIREAARLGVSVAEAVTAHARYVATFGTAFQPIFVKALSADQQQKLVAGQQKK